MRYPIKYIENNLVFNHDGECFAYYELLPYNYSFLSPDEKIQVHDHFRQLIAQNQDGKIHALQISTASSIRSVQERSKNLVTGRLKDVAYARIDDQTEALVSMIGEHQVDYRFFIGFKLLLNEEEVSMKSMGKSIKNSLSSFVRDVNHHLMGDFVSMPHDEMRRFSKMESLLQNKISRRFKIRPLDKNDFGYLIEHLHGQSDIAYEEYDYVLPLKKLKQETLVKRYDIIKPTRCLMEENQRYLKIEQEEQTTYVAYFTINSIVGDLEFPSDEIFYYQQQQFTFPIDTSMNVEIVTNKKALSTVRNKKKELKDLDNHAWESNNETGSNVLEALEQVNELEDVLDQSKESMYKLSYVIRVSASTLDELKQRCNEVKDFYDDLNVKLVRPFGDMIGLHSEFIPASKRYMNDYIQYVTSDFLAGLGFGATQMLGETEGIYFGYNLDTGRNVYLNPSLASQGVKGSVTNALASAFLGSLGGGKSFSNNLLVYYAVLYGGQALIVDPKAERGNWKETLPEMAHEINVVNLSSDDKNKGLLDPYVIMKKKKDSESLAIDILTFLTGISSRDGEKFPVLRRAIRAVSQQEERGLLLVIQELRSDPNPLARPIADHIESFTDYDFAHLLFSDGTVKNSISLEKQLNIIQVADLVLPDAETSFEEYTTMELLSVAMLIVISTFALDFIHSDRSVFKMVDLDEAWSFLQVAQGKTLSNKLVRAGRAMNAGVYFVTQNADDLTDEKLKNNIGVKFAFRSRDINEIKKTLEFFGVDKDDEGNQRRLRELENGQCLIQDLYGRVGIIQVHPVFEDLFDAFDTRPPTTDKKTR
nr:ATP-binding protein [Mammaliicoccus lentus]